TELVAVLLQLAPQAVQDAAHRLAGRLLSRQGKGQRRRTRRAVPGQCRCFGHPRSTSCRVALSMSPVSLRVLPRFPYTFLPGSLGPCATKPRTGALAPRYRGRIIPCSLRRPQDGPRLSARGGRRDARRGRLRRGGG